MSTQSSTRPAPLAGASVDRGRAVHGDHGYLDHRCRAPRHPGRARVLPREPVLGLQRVRSRLRRPPASRRAPVRPLGRPPGVLGRLGDPRCRLPDGRPGQFRACRVDRTGCPGRWCGADAVDDVVWQQPQGTAQGSRALWRGSARRWDRRGVSGRCDHRVHQLAMGVLHQHPSRSGHAVRRASADARHRQAAWVD
jgi:hypothetical protein